MCVQPQPAPEIVAAIQAIYLGNRERPLPVTVFQMAEDLTGRQVAEAVRIWIDWKHAPHLPHQRP